MTKQELETRIQKTEETIEKKQKLVKKYEAKIEKITADPYTDAPADKRDWWRQVDIEDVEEDIKRTKKAIEEKKTLLAKYQKQYNATSCMVNFFENRIPEVMKGIVEELETKWNEADKAERDRLNKDAREMSYSEFFKHHTGAEYTRAYRSNAEIEKDNHLTAQGYVYDLWNRINEKTGEVTDWTGVTCNGVALNGIVKGEKGTVRVETILAGGYNIQRLHCRTLVHEI